MTTTETAPAARKYELREFVPDVGNAADDAWPQADFLFDREHFYVGYFGGVGIGKTLTLVQDAFAYALEYPGSRQIMTEPSYQMIRDIILPTISEHYGQYEGRAFTMTRSPPLNITFTARTISTPGQRAHSYEPSEVWLRSTEVGQRSYGPNVHRILSDELTIGHQDEAFQILSQRARWTFGDYARQVKCTGTPKGRNWVWKFFINAPRGDRPAYQASTRDNPHLPANYVSNLLEVYGGWDSPIARQELAGQWLQLVGPVYPMFGRQVHVRTLPVDFHWSQFRRRLGGIDFGAVNPTALIAAGVAPTGRAYAYAEWYKHQANFDDMVLEMNRWKEEYGILRWVADPAGKKEIEYLRGHGFDVVPAPHHNDLKLRVGLVAARLQGHDGKPGCYITPSCPNLITELETLSWRRVKIPGLGEETMNDEFERGAPDHAHDAWACALSEIDEPAATVPDWKWRAKAATNGN